MEFIKGGVTAPQGFSANGIHCGIRKNKSKRDLALIVSDTICSASCVYTKNLVKGAPLIVTAQNLKNKKAQAIICNSGNANTCNANGIEIAEGMCELVSKHTGIAKEDVIVASTGVIGQPLSLEPIASGMAELVCGMGNNSIHAAHAIMTTDTVEKEVAISFNIGGKECKMGCIAKGSGMIHPNMATMLVFVTTDVSISCDLLDEALKEDIIDSFNMISIDGDTSTNDMVAIMASGSAGNSIIDSKNDDYIAFTKALNFVTTTVCKKIAQDGEGATRLIECTVTGAKDKVTAAKIAKSVITISLVKTAIFGADANWGRVLCAIGYSGAEVDVNKIGVHFVSDAGSIEVCKNGAGVDFDEDIAKTVLLENTIIIAITADDGAGKATAWGCDLTYEYVKINGDYRT